jgi:hypothetical protein
MYLEILQNLTKHCNWTNHRDTKMLKQSPEKDFNFQRLKIVEWFAKPNVY